MMKRIDSNSQEELATAFAARYVAWMLFHKLFGAPPTAELLKRASAPEVRECVVLAFGSADKAAQLIGWLERFHTNPDFVDFSKIASEYSKIFEAPNMHAIPWEGAREGRGVLFDKETLKVREAYRAFGYEPVLVRRVPDDHIALECAFMESLCVLSMLDLVDSEDDGGQRITQLLRAQKDFIDDHLGRWVGDYAKEVREAFPESLYAVASLALAEYCAREQAFIQEHLTAKHSTQDR